MKEKKSSQNISSSYKEVKVGKTIYRVTSVFLGEKDLGTASAVLSLAYGRLNKQPTEHV